MIALDTNVLVRFMVSDRDAAEQNRAASQLVLATAATGEAILISNVVLCEFVWVLRRAYRLARSEIAAALVQLLETEHLVFESADATSRAAVEYAAGPADFSDYLLRNLAVSAGADHVVTFDRKFARADDVVLLT